MVGGGNDLGWSDLESPRGEYVLAHNGWVMNADPLVNFAAEGTKVSTLGEIFISAPGTPVLVSLAMPISSGK